MENDQKYLYEFREFLRKMLGNCREMTKIFYLQILSSRVPFDIMKMKLISTSGLQSGQTQKPTSHPVVSALKICISPKRLRSEVRKKALLEIQ